nr:MAG TPA: hypothetical protein [Caudoviricetes sp.]
MEEIKLNGQYKEEDGKRIMRLINEIKISGMRLAKVVEETDMPLIANIMAMRLCQYAAEKEVERSAKEVGGLEDKFLHALMIAERDNTLTTVEEVWGSVEDEDYFDRIVIQNKDGVILYYGDRSAGIPEKFENACVDHAGLNEDREVVITLAGKK